MSERLEDTTPQDGGQRTVTEGKKSINEEEPGVFCANQYRTRQREKRLLIEDEQEIARTPLSIRGGHRVLQQLGLGEGGDGEVNATDARL